MRRAPSGEPRLRGANGPAGVRPRSLLERSEHELVIRGGRVRERAIPGPGLFAANEDCVSLPEPHADLLDRGLIGGVELLLTARVDRVLPGPLVSERHGLSPVAMMVRDVLRLWPSA